ncbi:MAG: hypothetical protein ACOYM2_11735 [Rectinemataceae bacterium]
MAQHAGSSLSRHLRSATLAASLCAAKALLADSSLSLHTVTDIDSLGRWELRSGFSLPGLSVVAMTSTSLAAPDAASGPGSGSLALRGGLVLGSETLRVVAGPASCTGALPLLFSPLREGPIPLASRAISPDSSLSSALSVLALEGGPCAALVFARREEGGLLIRGGEGRTPLLAELSPPTESGAILSYALRTGSMAAGFLLGMGQLLDGSPTSGWASAAQPGPWTVPALALFYAKRGALPRASFALVWSGSELEGPGAAFRLEATGGAAEALVQGLLAARSPSFTAWAAEDQCILARSFLDGSFALGSIAKWGLRYSVDARYPTDGGVPLLEYGLKGRLESAKGRPQAIRLELGASRRDAGESLESTLGFGSSDGASAFGFSGELRAGEDRRGWLSEGLPPELAMLSGEASTRLSLAALDCHMALASSATGSLPGSSVQEPWTGTASLTLALDWADAWALSLEISIQDLTVDAVKGGSVRGQSAWSLRLENHAGRL